MDLSLVVRASDPAQAAEIARALGCTIADPNRPNPDAWTGRLWVALSITAAVDVDPGIYLGLKKHDKVVGELSKLFSEEAITVSGSDGGTVRITTQDGLSLILERNAPWRQTYNTCDVGTFSDVEFFFEEHRGQILEALSQARATDPRLVGHNLATGKTGLSWMLVVDAPDDADLLPVETLLLSLRGKRTPIVLRRSSTLKPDLLADINKQAFDI